MKFFLLIFLALVLNKNIFSQKNIVVIKAQKRQKKQNEVPSNSFTIKNDSIKSPSLKSHIETKSTLAKQESPKISSNDFFIPKIRGQRAQNTEIWLNEGLIYDPWTSTPISYSFNPKAFSSLTIYEGLSPSEMPSLSPFGLIQYQKNFYKSKARAGLTIGKPYGKSFWGLVQRKNIQKKNLNFGLFINFHETKGNYSYYDNKSTPFDPSNFKIRTLEHNEQKSFLIAPNLAFRYKKFSTKAYFSAYSEKRNLPNLDGLENKKNRLSNLTLLGQLELKLDLKEFSKGSLLPKNLSLISNHQNGKNTILNTQKTSKNNINTTRFSFIGSWKKKYLDLKNSFSYGLSSIDYLEEKVSHTSKRNYFELYSGYTTKFNFPLNFQNKYLVRFSNESLNQFRNKISFNYAFIVFYKKNKKNLYFQVAKSERLANLLEEFGNGQQIKASKGLEGEKNLHFELGFFSKGTHSFSSTIFCDLTHDKITFFASSFKTFKAFNINHSRILGAEFSHNYKKEEIEIYTGLSFIKNEDVSNPTKNFAIPLSPFYVSTNTITYTPQKLLFQIANRLIGPYYNDLANTIIVAPHIISDFSLGYTYKIGSSSLSAKLTLANLFNINSLTIKTTGKNERSGEIARSGFFGTPLPGRAWTLGIEAKI